MQRLAGIRVWTYIAARPDWVRDAPHWQARAREVEDLLSDALHERLTARFVDRRAALLIRRLDAGGGQALLSAVTRRGEVVVEGQEVGRVEGFAFVPDPAGDGEARKLVLRAARRALCAEMPRRVAAVEAAADAAFALTPDLRLAWDGHPIARLRRGASPLRPQIEVIDSEFLDGAQRERLRARLQRFLDADDRRRAGAAGPRHRGGGGRSRAARAAASAGRGAGGAGRRRRGGGGCGAAPQAQAARRGGRAVRAVHPVLAETASGGAARPAVGAVGGGAAAVAGAADGGWSRWNRRPAGRRVSPPPWAGCRPGRCCCGLTWRSGWRPNSPMPRGAAPRCRRPASPPASGCAARGCRRCCARLGYRMIPGEVPGPGQYGPPAPALLVPLRQRGKAVGSNRPGGVLRRADLAPARPVPSTAGPFAALAALLR